MAYSVNWLTKIVTVPTADLAVVAPGIYELDVLNFWAEVHEIQDGDGMPYIDIMRSNAPVTISGLTLARTLEVINGYRVEFEDGDYQVNLSGANNNILDARVQNQVSINANNSAGLQVVGGESGDCCCPDPEPISFVISEPSYPKISLPDGLRLNVGTLTPTARPVPAGAIRISLPESISAKVGC